jgi:hypothetical protein
MNVYVNQARYNEFARCVDDVGNLFFDVSDLDEFFVGNQHVALPVDFIRRVDYVTIFYQQLIAHKFFYFISHFVFLPVFRLRPD